MRCTRNIRVKIIGKTHRQELERCVSATGTVEAAQRVGEGPRPHRRGRRREDVRLVAMHRDVVESDGRGRGRVEVVQERVGGPLSCAASQKAARL